MSAASAFSAELFSAELNSAQLNSTELSIDLSRPINIISYRTALNGLAKCKPISLAIHYNFGDIALTTNAKNKPCQLQVMLQGELRENAEHEFFSCTLSTVKSIDWLYEGQQLRDKPPREILLKHPECKIVSDAYEP
jgi:hypothetical protein